MCGDSTKKEDVEKLMDGKKADMVFTDPPYNVNYSGRGKETSNKIENDNMTEKAFRDFLEAVFQNYRTILKETGGIYVCYASRTHREFEDSLNKANFEVRNQIIWVKLVASMGWGDYRWKHEPILYCHKKGGSLDFYGDRRQYTQWDEQRDDKWLLQMIKKEIKKQENGNSTVWRFGREFNYKHPTQKPVQMVTKAFVNSSKVGDIVTDLFLGSGSTLIATEKTNRICYGMELDPKYIDVIIQRWEDYTGNKAKKL
jgi:DNA modification methylase